MSASALLPPRRQSRPRLALVLLSLLLLGGSLVHLGLGARWIAPQTVLQALLHYDPRNFDHRIIVDLRRYVSRRRCSPARRSAWRGCCCKP